jgi:acyl-CoA thioesterase II
MSESPRSLLSLLTLSPVGEDRWSAPTPAEGPPRLFGGQVAAQPLRAACLTVPAGPRPHSLHGYFIRPGRPDTALDLLVERTRDGRSFTTRHVTAIQEGQAIFELTASFHTDEEGLDWQEPPATAPAGPVDADEPGDEDSPFGGFRVSNPFIIRPVRAMGRGFSMHPCWVRIRETITEDPALQACALAYVSDLAVVQAARAPGSTGMPFGASLDHAVWFHRPVDVNQWLLFSAGPVSNYGARGLARGTFHTLDGLLVASIAQEALLRTTGRFPMPPGMADLKEEDLAAMKPEEMAALWERSRSASASDGTPG